VRALRGVLVATEIFGGTGLGIPLAVALRDTGGTSAGAARAVSELVKDEGAVVIVGPLTSQEAPGAAVEAQRLRVPIITLTQREGIVSEGEYVFRALLTPRDEARAIGRYAVERLFLKRFAVLHPDDAFGQGLSGAFTEEVSSRGGRVVLAQSYRGVFDIPEILSRMTGAGHGGASEPPPFQAIFMPDSVFAARVMAERLKVAGHGNLRLLGTSLWNTPEAIEGHLLHGAIFAAAFVDSSSTLAARRFTNAYKRTFGEEPDAVAAQAYDAAALLVNLLRERPMLGPEGLRSEIFISGGIEGAAGTLSFAGQRTASRSALILSIGNEGIVPVAKGIVAGPADSTR
jgi:ABC-type branched-subunit amino acid transport system substrate-binding protein